MKVKNITIGIKSLEEGLREFAELADSVRHGKVPGKRKEKIYFVSLDAMRRILTPKRLDLLHSIREKHPKSIYELARAAKRDLKNVQEDVSMLARIGLVSLGRVTAGRQRVIPRVEYDSLQLRIPVI